MGNVSSIDKDLAVFNSLRAQYDPWYQYTDDHSVWMKHSSIRLAMITLKRDLGLFGQNLTVPVCNPRTGSMEYR